MATKRTHPPSQDVLAALRAATRDVHERLHEHPALACLNQAEVSMCDYQFALRALQRFHESVERALTHLDVHGADDLHFSNAIRQDLHDLGAGDNSLPYCPALSTPCSASALLGVRYVLEGSALGGQLIARRVARAFGWPEDAPGLAHFRRGGGDGGRRWRQVLADLKKETVVPEPCVRAAVETFELLEDWLWQAQKARAGQLEPARALEA